MKCSTSRKKWKREELKKKSQKKAADQNLAAVKAALRGVITQTENEQRRGIQKRVVEADEGIRRAVLRGLARGGKRRAVVSGRYPALLVVSPGAAAGGLPLPPAITPPLLPADFVPASDDDTLRLQLYNPLSDSTRLKAAPDSFEELRGNYPLRREWYT